MCRYFGAADGSYSIYPGVCMCCVCLFQYVRVCCSSFITHSLQHRDSATELLQFECLLQCRCRHVCSSVCVLQQPIHTLSPAQFQLLWSLSVSLCLSLPFSVSLSVTHAHTPVHPTTLVLIVTHTHTHTRTHTCTRALSLSPSISCSLSVSPSFLFALLIFFSRYFFFFFLFLACACALSFRPIQTRTRIHT